jgi:hypothetical protein
VSIFFALHFSVCCKWFISVLFALDVFILGIRLGFRDFCFGWGCLNFLGGYLFLNLINLLRLFHLFLIINLWFLCFRVLRLFLLIRKAFFIVYTLHIFGWWRVTRFAVGIVVGIIIVIITVRLLRIIWVIWGTIGVFCIILLRFFGLRFRGLFFCLWLLFGCSTLPILACKFRRSVVIMHMFMVVYVLLSLQSLFGTLGCDFKLFLKFEIEFLITRELGRLISLSSRTVRFL